MKNLKIILGSFLLGSAMACSVPEGIEEDTSYLETPAAENLSVVFDISNDNSGNVTITPTAEGAMNYVVNYGAGSGSDASATLKAGESTTTSYLEGDYTVNVTARNIAGEETSRDFPLSIVYRAPENLMITPVVNGNELTVSAEADFANSFLVFYGDAEDEAGTPMAVGETLPPYAYAEPGVYTVRVVAESGGAATTEATTEVSIFAPFEVPITFDNEFVNYFFGTFDDTGVQAFATVENPDKSGINTSDMVGKFVNGHASWSGTYSPLNNPLDFSNGKVVSIMVYNDDPANIGKKLNLELEWPVGATEANPYGAILKQPITKSGEWEVLTFDFGTIAAIPDDAQFTQLVLRFNDVAEGAGEIIYIDNITQN